MSISRVRWPVEWTTLEVLTLSNFEDMQAAELYHQSITGVELFH